MGIVVLAVEEGCVGLLERSHLHPKLVFLVERLQLAPLLFKERICLFLILDPLLVNHLLKHLIHDLLWDAFKQLFLHDLFCLAREELVLPRPNLLILSLELGRYFSVLEEECLLVVVERTLLRLVLLEVLQGLLGRVIG